MPALTKEQSFFLSALSDYIRSVPAVVPKDVDKAALAKLAKAQQLPLILFHQTHLPALQSSYANASFHALNRKKQLAAIDREFKASPSIPYLIFKGQEIAKYYPHPGYRTSGDIDLLVHSEDKESAGRILEGLGLLCKSKSAGHEWSFQNEELEIELHHRLLYDDELNNATVIAFADTVWEHTRCDNGCCHHMEPEFHFVYLLLHLRKHFLWCGVGIKMFLDLAMMTQNANLDWEKVREYLKACGMEKFAAVSFALVQRWFGVAIPLPQAALTEEFFYQATNAVLTSSSFGDLDQYILNYSARHGKLYSALEVLFPPYEQMRSKYPAMGKYKMLLPLLWLRRMMDALLHHTALSGLGFAGKHLVAADKERTEELEAWGIR